MDNRRGGLTEEELRKIAAYMSEYLPPATGCRLSEEQQKAVVELITQKKRAVKFFLYLIGAMFLWVLKDAYLYIISHITFGWGK